MGGTIFDVSTIEMLSSGEIYGQAIAEVGQTEPNVVVLTADLMRSNKTGVFKDAFPERYFDFGIAEQNMFGAAAGMAACGKIPYVSTMAAFASMRACEMVRTDIAYPNFPVRIVSTHSGLSMGNGGTTHHCTEDLAIMRAIPNMTVIVPAGPRQCARIIKETVHHPGPIYMRIGRGAEPVIYPDGTEYDWQIGKSITLKEGDDVTVFACSFGIMNAIFASEWLEEDDDVHIRVVDMHTIKPIDREAIIKAAKETKAILTVEDHNIIGGLGSAVAEVIAEENLDIPFRRIGVPDEFAVIGEPEQLHARYGYDDAGIHDAVLEILGK